VIAENCSASETGAPEIGCPALWARPGAGWKGGLLSNACPPREGLLTLP